MVEIFIINHLMAQLNNMTKLILTWSKNCVLADMTANPLANPAIVAPTGLEFK